MTDADFICANLARIAYYDGFSEGLSGMLACAFTIRNRVKAGWFGGDWIQVLSHHKEKAADLTPFPEELPDPKIRSVRFLLHEVTGIFTGARKDDILTYQGQDEINKYLRDSSSGYGSAFSVDPSAALYYGRLDTATNPWFIEKICRDHENHKRIATVGMLTFFT